MAHPGCRAARPTVLGLPELAVQLAAQTVLQGLIYIYICIRVCIYIYICIYVLCIYKFIHRASRLWGC